MRGDKDAGQACSCGALLYVKGRSIPALVGALAAQLRLPAGIRHVWIVDRGILARPLLRALAALGQFALGRVRANQVVYFAPRRQPRKGRKKTYGQKCRVDQLVRRFPDRLRKQRRELRVQGKERAVEIYDAEVLLRSVHRGRACEARLIIVIVPGLKKLKPWYLVTTDLELGVIETVEAYAGRAEVEVNFDEAKELGLGHYQGRSGSGVRRWAVLVCLSQALLKLAATGLIKLDLPRLNWSWYKREETVGQVRRRLIEHCRPRISRTLNETPAA
ncbi:MAG TPA: transposase [Blastocatellia bacterium]|nr:transposase [Blastocatellia bacterium]